MRTVTAGEVYLMPVDGKREPVRVIERHPECGWVVVRMKTGTQMHCPSQSILRPWPVTPALDAEEKIRAWRKERQAS